MALRQTKRPGPRREKKRQPKGEEGGLEGKKEIRDKGKKGAWWRRETTYLCGLIKSYYS
jgi:hypothetical protein